jgi:hypothetical protein
MKFGWTPDMFDAGATGRLREKKAHEEIAREMHARPFNPAKNKKTLSHEYPFLGMNEKSVFDFLTASDPYQAPVSERLRN